MIQTGMIMNTFVDQNIDELFRKKNKGGTELIGERDDG